MRFTDEQTEQAIQIIESVRRQSGAPLLSPEEAERLEAAAANGDGEAYVELITAKLRLLYPDIPKESKSSLGSRLWQSIEQGRLEGILVVSSLDYRRAWEEIQAGTQNKIGSYFERWQSSRLKNELAAACCDGYSLQ